MKEWMNFKTAAVFISSFILFLLGFHGLSLYFEQQQKAHDFKQNQIIIENIKGRFKLFLRTPVTLGIIGAEHFSDKYLKTADYSPFSKKIFKINDELIGLNLLDNKGKIIRGYPPGLNPEAIGQITTNFKDILASYQRGETFWFSPPFKLYRGVLGFVLYFPITQNKQLKGWFSPVISTDIFKRDFQFQEFINNYHLIIKDQITEIPYFSTALEPSNEVRSIKIRAKVDGRDLVFMSWRKKPSEFIFFPWSWSIITALLLSLVAIYILRMYDQRKKIRYQLGDVSVLLKLTSKEALSKLIDLQGEAYKLGSSDTIKYITHLIEQIDLLQTTANTKKVIECENIDLLTSLMNELDEVHELVEKKSLKVHFIREKLLNITIMVNPWLFQNSVLNNILTHAIINADMGTGISIEYQRSKGNQILLIHIEQIHKIRIEGEVEDDRRMNVAKKVLNLFHGDMEMEEDMGGGKLIKIILPLQKGK